MAPLVQRRRAGKLGRKPGPSRLHGELLLADYMVDPLPVWNAADDFTSGKSDWGMAGNDEWGDCGPAGDYHKNYADSLTAKETAPPVPETGTPACNGIVTSYFTYEGSPGGAPNPAYDEGVDLGEWLLWRITHGLAQLPPIGGFAEVSDSGAEYQSAFHLYGGLYTGILVNQEMMDEFEEGLPWTSTNTDWIGGHCVPHLARNAEYGRAITWGGDQLFTWPNWRVTREEAYVIFTPEMMATPGGVFHGVNVAQLKADIALLRGTT